MHKNVELSATGIYIDIYLVITQINVYLHNAKIVKTNQDRWLPSMYF